MNLISATVLVDSKLNKDIFFKAGVRIKNDNEILQIYAAIKPFNGDDISTKEASLSIAKGINSVNKEIDIDWLQKEIIKVYSLEISA